VNGFLEKSPVIQALMEKFLGGASNKPTLIDTGSENA